MHLTFSRTMNLEDQTVSTYAELAYRKEWLADMTGLWNKLSIGLSLLTSLYVYVCTHNEFTPSSAYLFLGIYSALSAQGAAVFFRSKRKETDRILEGYFMLHSLGCDKPTTDSTDASGYDGWLVS